MPSRAAASAWVQPSDYRSRCRSSAFAGPGCSRSSKPSPSTVANRRCTDALGARAPVSHGFTVAASKQMRSLREPDQPPRETNLNSD